MRHLAAAHSHYQGRAHEAPSALLTDPALLDMPKHLSRFCRGSNSCEGTTENCAKGPVLGGQGMHPWGRGPGEDTEILTEHLV